jgi:hypothetical protein
MGARADLGSLVWVAGLVMGVDGLGRASLDVGGLAVHLGLVAGLDSLGWLSSSSLPVPMDAAAPVPTLLAHLLHLDALHALGHLLHLGILGDIDGGITITDHAYLGLGSQLGVVEACCGLGVWADDALVMHGVVRGELMGGGILDGQAGGVLGVVDGLLRASAQLDQVLGSLPGIALNAQLDQAHAFLRSTGHHALGSLADDGTVHGVGGLGSLVDGDASRVGVGIERALLPAVGSIEASSALGMGCGAWLG